MLLALDLGTKTGWALGETSVLASGVQQFKNDRYSGGGMRYLRFRRWLDELHSVTPLTEIRFEEVRRHRGTDAAHVYGGLLGALTAWAEDKSIPYGALPVGTIKKSLTGNGNASKDAMIAAVRKKGFAPADDNEADALAIFLHCMSEIEN